MTSSSSPKVFGTSSETTRSVIAKPNTASLKPSTRETSRRRPLISALIAADANSCWLLTLSFQLDQPGWLVKKDVDQDAGHRHIEPDRKRPARYPTVLRIPPLEPARQGDERERQNRGGEGDVRQQNREVDRPDQALALERHRPDLRVIDDVANQKQRRRGECHEHHLAVLLDSPLFDQHVGDDEEYRRNRVERRVHRRQIVYAH